MIATTKTDEFVGITGPFSKKASGKFKADGETPIMVPCAPYWVVRYVGSYPYSVLQDRKFGSEAQAKAFAATLRGYKA